ncbi:MAG: carboxymuconolactone decarboxylase family protein, partial [Rhizobiales bacterium]|nr:carboxymuconolactone decarboxylase family protein [Hyphomicrobiales bacterium]
VSAIEGCGMCIDAHVNVLITAGKSKTAIQSTIRIAAIINATAQALEIA